MKKTYVYRWLCETASEMESIAQSNLGAKYKLMLLMTYVDIFSQVWDVFLDQNVKTQNGRFQNWLDSFLMDDDFLEEGSTLGPLNSQEIYQVRNALLHYASLPKSNRAMFISDLTKPQMIERHPDKLDLKKSVVLAPKLLYPKVIVAFARTLTHIAELEATNEVKFSKFIEKMYSKLESNSAMAIYPAGS